jgi:pimeloyl-ACP methyl ester carboxylesterase
MYETILSELKNDFGRTSDELDAARHGLGSIPLIVLSSDEAHFTEDRPKGVDADALYAAWIAGHVGLTRDSTRGEHRIVPGASHFIFIERPEVVLSAFREVVNAARASEITAASP